MHIVQSMMAKDHGRALLLVDLNENL